MTRHFHVTGLAFLFGLLIAPSVLIGQTNVGCLSATDPYAQVYRDGYGSMVSRTDAGSVAQRTRLGLPNIPGAQVTIVSDTTTCRVASAAYDAALGESAPGEPPLVLQLSDRYVVVKRLGYPRGRGNVLFDQNFATVIKKIWY